MKKIIIAVALAVVAFVAYNCFDGCGGKKSSKFEVSSVSYNMEVEEPAFVNAYIDASGSMKGYFSKNSDGRFITALSNAAPQKTMWMDSKKTELQGIPTNQLLTNRFSGGDSRFDMMLSDIIIRDSLNKSNGVSLLFTDGILSASVAQTDRTPEYMPMSFTVFKNEIAKAIKGKGVAVSVLKLESKYDGTYWNYQNKSVPNLQVENRPFYVIAMGKADRIRHFMANNKLDAKLTAEFGVYDNTVDITSVNTFTPATPKDWEGTKFKGNKIEFYLTLPNYVAKLGNAYIKNNLVVEIDSIETSKLDSCINVMGTNLSIKNWDVNDGTKPILTPGEHALTVKIKKTIPQEWKLLYTEDDKDIKTNFVKQSQTFALEYLLKGIKEGTETDDMIIFSSTIKFSK